jgi:hypothetical protein
MMTHFAKLDENNVVVFVTVGRDEDIGKEDELSQRTGEIYKETSSLTRAGIHYDPETKKPSEDQSKAFRGNYAGIGYVYDETLDAFIPPKPSDDAVLDENTFSWIIPEDLVDTE